jgi:hypothetical protein
LDGSVTKREGFEIYLVKSEKLVLFFLYAAGFSVGLKLSLEFGLNYLFNISLCLYSPLLKIND